MKGGGGVHITMYRGGACMFIQTTVRAQAN